MSERASERSELASLDEDEHIGDEVREMNYQTEASSTTSTNIIPLNSFGSLLSAQGGRN